VARESGAWRAGIDAGDELIAVGGTRVEGTNLEGSLRGRSPGDTVEVVIVRDGRLLTKSAALDPPRQDRVKLVARPDAPAGTRAVFAAWLGQPHPVWGGSVDGVPALGAARSKAGAAS
jgi:predicted metalloprotease with PDZ domain